MKYLVFNSKGGCGKSTVSREIIGGPLRKDMVLIEIDELNKTQKPYANSFKSVIELSKDNIRDLFIHINENNNVIIDVGIDNISKTIDTMTEYDLFSDIDKLVIPMNRGRSDDENAIKTYDRLRNDFDNIMFVFMVDNEKDLEYEHSVFFNNINKVMSNFSEKDYVTISKSNVFIDAQNEKKLVLEIADGLDYKSLAFEAKDVGDMEKFEGLMRKELDKRAAKILVSKCIMPAHKKLVGK